MHALSDMQGIQQTHHDGCVEVFLVLKLLSCVPVLFVAFCFLHRVEVEVQNNSGTELQLVLWVVGRGSQAGRVCEPTAQC